MAERAVVVMMMVGVATMPVPVMCPTSVCVPPTRPVAPVPRTMPSVPCVAPEPIVDERTIYIYRFDDIVYAIYVLIADNLYGYIVALVFLDIYGGYILVYILCEDSLQND